MTTSVGEALRDFPQKSLGRSTHFTATCLFGKTIRWLDETGRQSNLYDIQIRESEAIHRLRSIFLS